MLWIFFLLIVLHELSVRSRCSVSDQQNDEIAAAYARALSSSNTRFPPHRENFFYMNCDVKSKGRNTTTDISSSVVDLQGAGYGIDCPFVESINGSRLSHKDACRAVLTSGHKHCLFSIRNVVVEYRGGIIHAASRKGVLMEPHFLNQKQYASMFTTYFQNSEMAFRSTHHDHVDKGLPRYGRVLLTRHIFDGFTHSSFDLLPYIGLVQATFPDTWRDMMWHTSTSYGALVELAGVPAKNILEAETIYAREAILVWKKDFQPSVTVIAQGISNKVAESITNNLLRKNLSAKTLKAVDPLQIWSPPNITKSTDLPPGKRLVLYMNRPKKGKRGVANEPEILMNLAKVLQPDLQLVVVASDETPRCARPPNRNISFACMQRFAELAAHARVLMGPHGGAFNNLMFTPDDCDIVEFNLIPPSGDSRQCFMNAAWSKFRNSSRYIVIPPISTRDPEKFYNSAPMMVNVKDVLDAFATLGLLRSD